MAPCQPIFDCSPNPPRMPLMSQPVFCSQPVEMNRAVMNPHAMNAGMFGMTMFERKVPKRCTWTRAPPGFFVVDVTVVDVIAVPRFCRAAEVGGGRPGLCRGGEAGCGRADRLPGVGRAVGGQGDLGQGTGLV